MKLKLNYNMLSDKRFIDCYNNTLSVFILKVLKILIDSKELGEAQALFNIKLMKLILRDAKIKFLNDYRYNTIIDVDNIELINNYPTSKKLLKFNDGAKEIIEKIFNEVKDKKYLSFDLFSIKIKDIIQIENQNYSNEIIDSFFNYLTDKFSFITDENFDLNYSNEVINYQDWRLVPSYNISKSILGSCKSILSSDIIFTIKIKFCADGCDKPIDLNIDESYSFDNLISEINNYIKTYKRKQRILKRIQKDKNKYLN